MLDLNTYLLEHGQLHSKMDTKREELTSFNVAMRNDTTLESILHQRNIEK